MQISVLSTVFVPLAGPNQVEGDGGCVVCLYCVRVPRIPPYVASRTTAVTTTPGMDYVRTHANSAAPEAIMKRGGGKKIYFCARTRSPSLIVSLRAGALQSSSAGSPPPRP